MIKEFLAAKDIVRLARIERKLFFMLNQCYQPQNAPEPIRALAVGQFQAVKAGRQKKMFPAVESMIIEPALVIMRNFPAAKDEPAIAWANQYCEEFYL